MSTGQKLLVHRTADEVRNNLPSGTRRRVNRILKILRTDPQVSLPNVSPMTGPYSGVNIVQGPDFKIFYSVASDPNGNDYVKVSKIEASDVSSNPEGYLSKGIATAFVFAEYEFNVRSFRLAKGYRAMKLRIRRMFES